MKSEIGGTENEKYKNKTLCTASVEKKLSTKVDMH